MTLESDGILPAIEELADTTSALAGIECTCKFDGGDLPLDRTRAPHLFRIVQEAVSNAVRHGKARHVSIELRRTRTTSRSWSPTTARDCPERHPRIRASD